MRLNPETRPAAQLCTCSPLNLTRTEKRLAHRLVLISKQLGTFGTTKRLRESPSNILSDGQHCWGIPTPDML